jgi:alkylated DNA repair protein alkB family protein 6
MALDFKAMMASERTRVRGETSSAVSDEYCLSPKVSRPTIGLPLQGIPNSVWHIAEFVTKEEEQAILRVIDATPNTRWTPLLGRRLQSLGGLPRVGGMKPEPMPPMASSIVDTLNAAGVFDATAPPNHVLLNEYAIGQGPQTARDNAAIRHVHP